MEDKLGIPVEVGDLVLYTGGSRGVYELQVGVVLEITERKTVKIKNYETNGKLSRTRDKDEILNISIIKNSFPEYFI